MTFRSGFSRARLEELRIDHLGKKGFHFEAIWSKGGWVNFGTSHVEQVVVQIIQPGHPLVYAHSVYPLQRRTQ
jgi:hypothetical protein